MIRRDLPIAMLAVGVMMCFITPTSLAQSTIAAPNAPISVTPDAKDSAKPKSKPAPAATIPPLPEPVPRQEQLPLGVSQSGAQTGDHAQAATSDTTSSSTWGGGGWIVQTLLALALVIALIFALRLLLRRLTGWRQASGSSRAEALVEVMARSTIAPKTSVIFLKINQRIVVAGQTPQGLHTLTEFDDPDQVAAILTQIEAGRPHSITRSFGSLMKQADRSYQTTDQIAAEGGDDQEHLVDRTRDHMSGLLSRMRSLKNRNEGDA